MGALWSRVLNQLLQHLTGNAMLTNKTKGNRGKSVSQEFSLPGTYTASLPIVFSLEE